MALEKQLLDSLGLEIAKKKYYNAAKVDSAIEGLIGRMRALAEENGRLRERINELTRSKEEIGDALISARTISQQMISDARAEGERIISEAREKADALMAESEERRLALLGEGERQRQELVERAQALYDRMREGGLAALRQLDGEWQGFLCSLGEDEDDGTAPDDISEKVGRIAEGLLSIGSDED